MKNNLSILWLIDGLGPGGAEQLMPGILKHLKMQGVNLRVCVLQIKGGNSIASEIEPLGIPVDLLLIPNLRHPLNLFRIVRYLRKNRPKILHTQLEFADILGGIAGRFLGIPTISTLHTLDITEESSTADWRLKLRWFILRHFTNHIIAVSQKTRDHHLQKAKIDAKKITTIYNGVELERFKNISLNERKAAKQALNIHPGQKIILTVAVLREPKGIQFMLKALPSIIEKVPNTHYLIAGDGSYKTQLLELAHSLNLDKHVTFIGHRTDIPMLLGCCDLFVLPTLIDALPTVLIETLAAEKPIIATNIGGIPEIVVNEVNGLLVPAGKPENLVQACVKLLGDKEYCEELTNKGRQTVQQLFDINVQIKRLMQIYEETFANYEK